MNKGILMIGGGGHCKSVLDSLLEINWFSKVGIIDIKSNIGKEILSIPVIGCDDDLEQLFNDGYKYAFVAIGSIGNPKPRIRLSEMLENIGFEIVNIIDPSAVVSRNVKMGSGIFIGKNVVINAGSTIGKGAIINTGAIIEHDCSIGEFVHIAPGSVLSGEVKVEEGTHIGTKTVIRQQLKIGSNSVIGMGSVVTKPVKDNVIAYGNPCKEVRAR